MSTPEAPVSLSVIDALVPSDEVLQSVKFSKEPADIRPGLQMLAAMLPRDMVVGYMAGAVALDSDFARMLKVPRSTDCELANMTDDQRALSDDAARLVTTMYAASGHFDSVTDPDIFFTGFWSPREPKGDPVPPKPIEEVKNLMHTLGGPEHVAQGLEAIRTERQARVDTIGAWVGSSSLDDFMAQFRADTLQVSPDEQVAIGKFTNRVRAISQVGKNRLVEALDSTEYTSKAPQLAKAIAEISAAIEIVLAEERWQASIGPKGQDLIERMFYWRKGYVSIQGHNRELAAYFASLEAGRQAWHQDRHESALEILQSDAAGFVEQHSAMIGGYAPMSGKKLRSSEYWSLYGAFTGHTAAGKDEAVLKSPLDKATAYEWIGTLHGLREMAEAHQDDAALSEAFQKILADERSVLTEYYARADTLKRYNRRASVTPARALVGRFAELGGHWGELVPLFNLLLAPKACAALERIGVLLRPLDSEEE